MTIGQRIAWIRKEHGLSQEAFGETFGVSRQAISKWESDSCL
ncbi:MAG: helix-turn-helix transcriptional regulator [Lachnospiraceae bacterium]|nr:helix-turn-helix transcriptional regulator [Lachnospiraceae bacterium]